MWPMASLRAVRMIRDSACSPYPALPHPFKQNLKNSTPKVLLSNITATDVFMDGQMEYLQNSLQIPSLSPGQLPQFLQLTFP